MAAGDRFIKNKNQDKDVVITINKGGVITEALRIAGSTGNATGTLASKWQKKNQASDTGTGFTGTLTNLTFNNLEVGKIYRAFGQIQLKSTVDSSSSQTVTVNLTNSGTIQTAEWLSAVKSPTTLDPQTANLYFSVIFTAAATTLTTVVAANSGGAIKFIGGANISFMFLEELPMDAVTTQWT